VTGRCGVFVDGRWLDRKGVPLEVVNPATEEVIADVSQAQHPDVDAAVAAARAAFPLWAHTTPAERRQLLAGIEQGLEERSEELARTVTAEIGSPLWFSRSAQVGLAIAGVRALREALADGIPDERVGDALVVSEPVGVVAAITPWNFPLHQIVQKVIAALAAGCTVVLKPSELAPLSAIAFTEVLDKAGLPPGVVNLLIGAGPIVGERLARHDGIEMVSFTGSTATGRRVGAAAMAGIKKVTLELGGKSANLLLDDCDWSTVVPKAVRQCFANSGQTCVAFSRLLVPDDHVGEVEELCRDAARSWAPGNPQAEGVLMGPLVSRSLRARVRTYIASGIAQGARRVSDEAVELPERGWYVAPTVFGDVTPAMTIAREEIFGPVLSVMPYRDVDEAVAVANDTPYGLSGGVWSADTGRAVAIARRLCTGEVAINGAELELAAPFGGRRRSGHGREGGRHGILEFLESKTLLGAA
jgi:aldehyde dehydrogenase (NAD+)